MNAGAALDGVPVLGQGVLEGGDLFLFSGGPLHSRKGLLPQLLSRGIRFSISGVAALAGPGSEGFREEGGGRMQLDISTRHGHLSDASRQKIEEKIGKLTRIFDRLTSIHLTIDLEHEETPSVDLQVAAEHKHAFVATDRGVDLMGSVDAVVHRMEAQLRKYKEKLQQRHRGEHDPPIDPEAILENLDQPGE